MGEDHEHIENVPEVTPTEAKWGLVIMITLLLMWLIPFSVISIKAL